MLYSTCLHFLQRDLGDFIFKFQGAPRHTCRHTVKAISSAKSRAPIMSVKVSDLLFTFRFKSDIFSDFFFPPNSKGSPNFMQRLRIEAKLDIHRGCVSMDYEILHVFNPPTV